MKRRLFLVSFLMAAAAGTGGCAKPVRPPVDRPVVTHGIPQIPGDPSLTEAQRENLVAQFDAPLAPRYVLGEGDEITVQVWARPELSGSHTIGPDGCITLPLAGVLRVANMTREQAAQAIRRRLLSFYAKAPVTVAVNKYVANRIIVLGVVRSPGVLDFSTTPTLLEALARAGNMPATGKESGEMMPARCAVIRGRERMAWVDIARLLNGGNLSLNLRLQPNDVVYVPDPRDSVVYVMGEVKQPGAYPVGTQMNLLDALARAGGTTRDAAPYRIRVIRPGASLNKNFSAKQAMTHPEENIPLQDGDVVYVPTNGLSDIGYFFSNATPGIAYFLLGRGSK